MDALIIHGSSANPDMHWFPWLAEELEKKGLEVAVPDFPVGEEQTLENWMTTLEPYRAELDDTILVGHSLGVPFILNVLNRWQPDVKASFLVSGFAGHLEVEGEPNVNDFSEREFDWDAIRSSCRHFTVFHGDDDPYVPLKKAVELAENLNVDPIVIESGGHLQTETDYTEFPRLLSEIEKAL